MQLVLPHNDSKLIERLEDRGDLLSLEAARKIEELHKIRSDFFQQLIEQGGEIDRLTYALESRDG